jgi:hypothetical protein
MTCSIEGVHWNILWTFITNQNTYTIILKKEEEIYTNLFILIISLIKNKISIHGKENF